MGDPDGCGKLPVHTCQTDREKSPDLNKEVSVLPRVLPEAVVAEDVDVIAPPDIDITAGREDGERAFDAVVVRPQVTVVGHDALREAEIEKPE